MVVYIVHPFSISAQFVSCTCKHARTMPSNHGATFFTSTPSTLVWGPDDLLATVSYLVHKLQYLYLVWHISLDHSYSLPSFLSYLLLLLLLSIHLFLSSFIHPSSSSPPLLSSSPPPPSSSSPPLPPSFTPSHFPPTFLGNTPNTPPPPFF